MRRGTKRWVAALVLGAALASPVLASPPGTVPETASLSRMWEAAATWFAGGWQNLVAELTADHGSMTDPDGATATAETDHGAMTDPNG